MTSYLKIFCFVLQRPKFGGIGLKNRKSISFLDDDKDDAKASRSDEKPDDDEDNDDVDKSNRRYSTSGLNLIQSNSFTTITVIITKL